MKKAKRKQKGLVASALLMAMLLTACGTSDTSASHEESGSSTSTYKELTVYTAYQDDENVIYFNAFEEATGIKINYVRFSAGEMFARIQSEKNNPNASLIIAGNTDYYEQAKQDGLLQQYFSPELGNIRDEVKDPDGMYTTISEQAIGFACNPEWFADQGLEYPTAWDDLLRDEFKDQISISHPSTAGTGYTIFMSLVEKLGEEEALQYYEKLKNNVRQFTKSGTAPGMEVALGEAAIGVMSGDDALTIASEGYPIEVVYPEDGTGHSVTGMAILNGAPEKELENAKAFIDFMLSVEGQELFIESGYNRAPLNENAQVADGVVRPSELNLIAHDAAYASENRERLIELFGERIDNPENVKS